MPFCGKVVLTRTLSKKGTPIGRRVPKMLHKAHHSCASSLGT